MRLSSSDKSGMSDDPRIAELLDRWEDLLEKGQQITPEELCRECPELLLELRRQIGELRWVGELLSPQPADGVHSLETPLTLGRYRLDILFGSGGFGRVWKGYDPELDRVVAIKVLRPERHGSVFQIARFVDEAKKVAKLRHPNIVTVYDAGRDQGCCFIVTDMIEGQDLSARMSSGKVNWSDAIEIVSKVADALDHAHQRGIIHRDIKPHNILLDARGEPYITDFGIAATVSELPDANDDASGTVTYMSPEQASLGGPAIDGRSDIYSLGVVFYELLTGRPPYKPRSIVGLREHFREAHVSGPRSVEQSIPPVVDEVCRKAIAVEVDQRWQTASEFAQALRACGQGPGTKATVRRVTLIAICIMLIAGLVVATRSPDRRTHPADNKTTSQNSSGSVTLAVVSPYRILAGHTGEITSCQMSNDHRHVITTATNDDGVFVWNVESGQKVLELDHICRFAYFRDENTVVTFGAGNIHTVKTWEFPSGKELSSVPFSGCFWRATLAAGSESLAYTTRTTIVTFDLSNQKDLLALPRSGSVPYGVAISADGTTILTAMSSGLVQLWNVSTGELLRELPSHNHVRTVAVSPTSSLAISAGWDNVVRVFDLQTDKQVRQHQFLMATATAFSPDGRRYVVAGAGELRVFDTETGEVLRAINGHQGKVITYVYFSPDGRMLVSGGRDFKVCMWQLE